MKSSAARIARLSIISSPPGITPAPMIRATAAPASATSSKLAISTFTLGGFGSSFTVTSVTMPSMPSEPVNSASRSKPGASSASAPSVSKSPSIVRISTFRMLCTVSPYFRQCTPPAFSATLPPIEHAICDDGSGA